MQVMPDAAGASIGNRAWLASDKGRRGVVRAAFKSREGQQFYAVEKDGAMDFLEEERLTLAPRVELAA